MSIATEQTIQVLQVVLQTVPMGTNLALLQLLWSILNGSFLSSRGALFPALKLAGFGAGESRRSWAALRYGVWRIGDLLASWRSYVQAEGQWQAYDYDGYHPVAADITAFWRPRLRGWPGKYFNGLISRLFGGVGFALVAEIGQVDGHRLPLLRKIIRAHPQEMSQKKLKEMVLNWLSRHLADNEWACPSKLPPVAGVGLVGGQHLDLFGGYAATDAHRLLGSLPKKRPAVSDASWLELIFQKMPWIRGGFGKSGRLQPTCRRALQAIGDKNGILNCFPAGLVAV